MSDPENKIRDSESGIDVERGQGTDLSLERVCRWDAALRKSSRPLQLLSNNAEL